ncbi:major facilitator superfamily domain-containing protein [Gamsiella multidivaricata]|uniref:major facilitator superfamily domain-containing protein n=1 Tax=Gamsiella multidivaricata TaxID=101098 RepID=UPI0022206262|nr:major facilitator superfamily domain-containing protein [Gamsiella multidivaricata]KAI7825098.1 major facilitator superfamily domain-containing protein [Gamsiella multidivaricata]
MTHRGSEQTISANEKDIKKEYTTSEEIADVEYGSATIDPEEVPALVDGPAYGWVIVFAACFTQMISMGSCNVYGVYQDYYLTHTFKGTASTFQLAWIGSLAVMALDVAGPFTGSICDHFGHRQASLVGVLIMALSLVAAAFSTHVWQLYLTQGLLYGFGASLTYFAGLSLPAQWFTRSRGLVTGIAISGGGIGGLWMSPIVSKLLNSKGFRFTMLSVAIAHLVLLIPACMLFKTRLDRKFVDFTIMKDLRFCLLFVAGIFVVSGYFTPFYFISSYAQQHGVDTSTAALMVGIMNGASAVGRIVMGLVSDKIGCINALLISTFAATLSLLLIWIFAKTVAVMFLFSVVYGLCCGAYLSSTVSVSAAICGLGRLATVTGIIYAGMAVGSLIGSPVSGAILDSIGHKTDYTGVILWSGTVMAVGTAILFVLRYVTDKNMLARV